MSVVKFYADSCKRHFYSAYTLLLVELDTYFIEGIYSDHLVFTKQKKN